MATALQGLALLGLTFLAGYIASSYNVWSGVLLSLLVLLYVAAGEAAKS